MRRAAREGSNRSGVDEIVNELVASSADPAYATTVRGKIVAWNRAASELLGHNESAALKTRCWRLLRGLDVHGNPLCGSRCPLADAVRRGTPVHRSVLSVHALGGECVRVPMSVVAVTAGSGERVMTHLPDPDRPADTRCAADDVPSAPRPSGLGGAGVLSKREFEVLRLVAGGRGTPEVARALGISAFTVRHHVRSVLEKLGVHSRLAAVYAAREAGLL